MVILDQPFRPIENLPDGGEANRILAFIIDVMLSFGLFLVPFVGPFIAIAYFFARDVFSFLDGQSVGKKAMNLRVVTLDGQPITDNWGAALLRNLPLLFCGISLFVELVVMFSNENNRRLGDLWAGTRVVSTI